MSERSARPDRYTAAVECGSHARRVSLPDLREPTVTRQAFLTLMALVDDPTVEVDELGEHLALTVEETGQLWIYPVDVFVQNLVQRRGDQTRARRLLARLRGEA